MEKGDSWAKSWRRWETVSHRYLESMFQSVQRLWGGWCLFCLRKSKRARMTEKSKRSSQRRKARWGIDCISSSKPVLRTLIFLLRKKWGTSEGYYEDMMWSDICLTAHSGCWENTVGKQGWKQKEIIQIKNEDGLNQGGTTVEVGRRCQMLDIFWRKQDLLTKC